MLPMLLFFLRTTWECFKSNFTFCFAQSIYFWNTSFLLLPEPDYPLEVAAQGERAKVWRPHQDNWWKGLNNRNPDSNPKLYLVVTPRFLRNYFLVLSVSWRQFGSDIVCKLSGGSQQRNAECTEVQIWGEGKLVKQIIWKLLNRVQYTKKMPNFLHFM